MTGIHDAQPGDIFVDDNDKLWRIVGRWDEPCVVAESVDLIAGGGALIPKTKQQGGISGLMWKGFRFLHRPKPPQPFAVIPSNWTPHMHNDR